VAKTILANAHHGVDAVANAQKAQQNAAQVEGLGELRPRRGQYGSLSRGGTRGRSARDGRGLADAAVLSSRRSGSRALRLGRPW
jgi:hypothetical protein